MSEEKSIFVSNEQRESDWGEWEFQGSTLDDVLAFRECFDGELSEVDEGDVSFDQIDFEKAKSLLADMIEEWPGEEEVSEESLSNLKTEVLMWAFNQIGEIIGEENEVTEDEEKNSSEQSSME